MSANSQNASWKDFLHELYSFIPAESVYTDELRRMAWGTDAGVYRLIPQVIVQSSSEKEIQQLLKSATQCKKGITFRAAGTSLSGQAISDSVLVIAGKNWEKYSLNEDASRITLQPGITGGRIQEILRPYKRRFSPDPASLKSAMLGGIVMNNASGMSCGTHANSDRVMISARIILPDGTLLDTGDIKSREIFLQTHPDFIKSILDIRSKIHQDKTILSVLSRKYSIKNVTGLNLLPFLRFEDPFEIIAHLMTGSEGTLAFLARATFTTEPIKPFRASTLVCFPDLFEACSAVQKLKPLYPAAVELFDRKALHAIENTGKVPPYVASLGETATALLIEAQATDENELKQQTDKINSVLNGFDVLNEYRFFDQEKDYAPLWALRSGIFPAAGGLREPGTSCLIEDVAFPIDVLPNATVDLQRLIDKYEYHDGVIYGHALEGNFHFIINQRFDSPVEIHRYEAFMQEVVNLVIHQYQGSLKAEHGTGRNMAPFVCEEWGEPIWHLMKEIKKLFDPANILNPGVIFNTDPHCHIKNLKPLPLTSPTIDKCIECGFCEINCVTAGFSLSARQRIVITREINRIQHMTGQEERRKELIKQFRYAGIATCAGDGLCATSCPMGINTGVLIHHLREKNNQKKVSRFIGEWSANNLNGIRNGVKGILYAADLTHQVLGTKMMSAMTRKLHEGSGKIIPLWTQEMPKPYSFRKEELTFERNDKVVYFPSCINQTFGASKEKDAPLMKVFAGLIEKADYQVIYPKGMKDLCCGTIWESKGMPEVANRKTAELEEALWIASEGGKYPIVCDQSPCLYRMRKEFKRLKPLETAEFLNKYIAPRLDFIQKKQIVAIHPTCSTRKMDLTNDLVNLASLCSEKVFVPEEIGCCGFAGDKGFTHPEVNEWALRKLKPQLQDRQIEEGYSNSRTCEIGLSTNSGITYKSIVYLVDECTTQKKH